MKNILRLLAIVTAFVITMGFLYVVVNAAGSTSGGAPQFERGEGLEFDGARPDLPPGGEGREFREGRGGGWMFGLIKNLGIVAIIVALITLPKNYRQKKRTAVPVRIE